MGAMTTEGVRLLQARETLRVSLRELCAECQDCKLDPATLSRIESGRRPASPCEERAILEALTRINARRQKQFRSLVQPCETNCFNLRSVS